MKLALSRKNLWEHLPRPLKVAASPVLSRVPPQYLLGRGFQQHLRFVEEAQWYSAEQARAYQFQQIQRILSLAYDRTSYYRRAFDRATFHPRDFKQITDLQRLPLLDRNTLREQLNDMCTVPATGRNVDYVSTGGTSGSPVQFYIGANRSQAEYAYLVAGWRRAGFRLGAPLAVFRGRVVPEQQPGFRHEYDPLLKSHFYSNFHMTDESMARYVEHVRGIGACFLHTYPSSAAALARFLRRSGATPPSNVQGILAESEIVYPEDRELVETAFGCRLFSSYGLTEKVVAAAECESSNNYHVWPTYGFFELVDEAGAPVTRPGQRGEIVGTGFINTVVPFIRYRTGDMATYVGEHCSACGREQTVVSDIRGHRIQEHLVASDGALISWTALNMHDDTFENVLRFQFRQETPGRAVLRIAPGSNFSSADVARIQRRLGLRFDARVEVTVEIVDAVQLSGSGKAIYVDQRIPGVGPADSEPSTAVSTN